jgi:predicted Zn-dependent peptidase
LSQNKQDQFLVHTFSNGLTLLGEELPGMQSVAMAFLISAGAAADPEGRSGCANVTSDLIIRGAGSRDSLQLTNHLDSLGLQRSSSVGLYHLRLACAGVGPRVMEGLEAYADIVRRPQLPETGFEAARDLALQAIAGIDDEPRQKLMIKLRERHFPAPFGRNAMGKADELEKLTLTELKADHARRVQPKGAILSLAGNLKFDRIIADVEKYFGDWKPGTVDEIKTTPASGNTHHEQQESEQTHIGIAYKSINETHPDYYVLRIAMEILSGGMSGRLFTEVREKRGLVYNVSAGFSGLKNFGSILGYAGTSNDRAQATLDCFIGELHRLTDGVTAAELKRAKTGLKASLIMQEESTSARASAMAHDYFMRGRIRTLDELKNAIDSVSLEQVNQWLKNNPPGPFTIVTVGPKPLKVPT